MQRENFELEYSEALLMMNDDAQCDFMLVYYNIYHDIIVAVSGNRHVSNLSKLDTRDRYKWLSDLNQGNDSYELSLFQIFYVHSATILSVPHRTHSIF